MSSFDLTKLIGYNFNGLDVDNVEIDNSVSDPGSSTDYVPGSQNYTVLGSSAGPVLTGFGGNDSDTGFGTPATVSEQITNASNGTTLTGGVLANPLALGQIEDTQTINGNPNSPVDYDVLGYSADGENILVGLSTSYNPATPNDPYGGQYYILSYNNIDGNATPSNFFVNPVSFSAANTFLSNNVTVSNSLIGQKVPSGDLTLTANGTAGVQVNADGSFTVVSTTSTLSIGAISSITAVTTAATGPQGQPTLKFQGSVPAYFQVIGFNADQVLLQSVKSTGVAAAGPAYAILSLASLQSLPINFTTTGSAPIVGTAIPCFLAGTAIATPDGERDVETLRAGDLVMTVGGIAKPVRWLGRSTVSTLFADPLRTQPICIRAGALGENLPKRDLSVSPDHAMFIDGVLVQAGALVNGTTITRRTDMPTGFIYYHLELDAHDLVLAEGAATETFVDNVDRMVFDNWNEHPAVAGEEMPELPYARAKSARQVPISVRRLIAARAAVLSAALAIAA